jgi:hypothetical protein
LFASGWTVDDVLDLTWEQVWFVAECVLRHKAQQINTVAEPVLSALGARKGKRAQAGRERVSEARGSTEAASPEERDARLLRAIGAAGFEVR